MRSQEVEVDVDALMSAIRDGLDGKEPGPSRAVIRDTVLTSRRVDEIVAFLQALSD